MQFEIHITNVEIDWACDLKNRFRVNSQKKLPRIPSVSMMDVGDKFEISVTHFHQLRTGTTVAPPT